ncbi:hypothetical protein GCM10010279_02000 [Streptomyces mutabilis]|nr:hypothetical protein GCM10010279_02000 [Streptomyces mutabilis]
MARPPVPAGRASRPPGSPSHRQYPVLRTLRVVHGDGGGPVEVTVMVKAGPLYELRYESEAG